MVDQTVSDQRRSELLEWISREGATVGHQIPETVAVAGEEFDLKEFVWETKRQGAVPPEYHDEVQAVRTKLKSERERKKERLAEAALTTAEAERLADTIVGLDRAIVALGNLYESDFGEEAKQTDIADKKRWLAFLDRLS